MPNDEGLTAHPAFTSPVVLNTLELTSPSLHNSRGHHSCSYAAQQPYEFAFICPSWLVFVKTKKENGKEKEFNQLKSSSYQHFLKIRKTGNKVHTNLRDTVSAFKAVGLKLSDL